MKILDWLAAAIIVVVSILFLMMTSGLGRTASLFPKILCITIFALVLLYIGTQLYKKYKNSFLKSSGKKAETKKALAGEVPKSGRWAIIIGSIIIYSGLIYLIGFGIASFFYAIVLSYFGGYRRMKVVVPVALGMAVFLVAIGRLFNIPLPTGLWGTLF